MNLESAHILVVDDDGRLRDLLKTYLSDNFFRVTTADSVATARAKMANIEFDLVILDRMMPGESGSEFASALRRTNEIPILMLTAMAETNDRIFGLEAGVDDYLVKPFEPRELLLRINSILRRVLDSVPHNATSQIKFGKYNFDIRRAGTGNSDLADLKQEFSDVPHDRGTLSMARTADPNSANSQFFICFDSAPHLDRQYSVFGKVIKGMEFVDMIKKGDSNSGSVSDPDKIISLR